MAKKRQGCFVFDIFCFHNKTEKLNTFISLIVVFLIPFLQLSIILYFASAEAKCPEFLVKSYYLYCW